MSKNSFLSFNAGYNKYQGKFCLFGCSYSSHIGIPVTFGINATTNNKRFNFYAGIEACLLHKTVYDDYNFTDKERTDFHWIIVPTAGMFIALTNNVSLTFNIKGILATDQYKYSRSASENIGISFSF